MPSLSVPPPRSDTRQRPQLDERLSARSRWNRRGNTRHRRIRPTRPRTHVAGGSQTAEPHRTTSGTAVRVAPEPATCRPSIRAIKCSSVRSIVLTCGWLTACKGTRPPDRHRRVGGSPEQLEVADATNRCRTAQGGRPRYPSRKGCLLGNAKRLSDCGPAVSGLRELRAPRFHAEFETGSALSFEAAIILTVESATSSDRRFYRESRA